MAAADVRPTVAAKPRVAAGGKSKLKIDFATVGGIVLAMGAIIGGLLLEKGSVLDIAQYTAAIIVLGGTAGAVMVSTPMKVLVGAMRRLGSVFMEGGHDEA